MEAREYLSAQVLSLLPTPRAGDGEKGGPNQRGSSGDLMLPSAAAMLASGEAAWRAANWPTPDWGWQALPQDEREAWSRHQLLPTPTTTQRGTDANLNEREGARANLHNEVAAMGQEWGQYASAIHRWEALTRPAPSPTEQDWDKWRKRKLARIASRKPVGRRGSIRFMVDGPPPRLSAAFSEWMMGLPAGWVTDVPGITRNEALKALGNGVVPQQAEAALREMLAWSEVAA